MIKYLKKKIERQRFQKLWRSKNHHNFTTPVNVFDTNKVTIGKGTYGPIELYTWDNSQEQLIIGDYCSLARGIKFILGGNHFFSYLSNYPWPIHFGGELSPAATNGPIIISDGVWIGMEAMILSGVSIGKGAVIGARTVVAKDVPPFAIVVGNPGRIINYRFDKVIIEKLMNIDYYRIIDKNFYESYKALLNQPLSEELMALLMDLPL